MAKDEIQLKKTDSILDEIVRLNSDISRRAFEFFSEHRGFFPGPLADWFRAERELVWSPAIELRQKDGVFELEASTAGVEPKDLDVQVTSQDILIKGTSEHRHQTKDDTVHVSEFQSGQLFRSVHLPEPIDPESVKAEYKNGLLRLTANIAKAAAPTKVEIKAA